MLVISSFPLKGFFNGVSGRWKLLGYLICFMPPCRLHRFGFRCTDSLVTFLWEYDRSDACLYMCALALCDFSLEALQLANPPLLP